MLKQMLRPIYGLKAFVTLVRNPDALEKVFELRDVLDDPAFLERAVAHFGEEEPGRSALAERPRLGRVELDALMRLPEGTLGRAFAEHMRKAGLDPAAIPTLPARTAGEYVPAHFYETHDIWHVVTDFGVDVAGELGLQAFYLAQFTAPLPLVILSAGMLNALFFKADDSDRRMGEIVRGYRLGKAAKTFFGVRWAEMWGTPLVEVRRRLGVPEAPGEIGLSAALPMAA